MARKKSVKRAAQEFGKATDQILLFFQNTAGLKDEFHGWCTDYAVIRLYREFEAMMLKALVGAINNDSASTLSERLGFTFPKHLTEDVCTYLIVGTGYFDFKGRDGLIKTLKDFVPDTHYLVNIVKDAQYKDSLEQLATLRNYAAHESEKAKKAAVKAIAGERFMGCGTWLKKQNRFPALCANMKKLAHDIEKKAPY